MDAAKPKPPADLCQNGAGCVVYNSWYIARYCSAHDQWSFGEEMHGNGIAIVIRVAQRTPITDEETTAKSIPLVSHLPNDHST
jgi:hypothetical protein